MRSAMFESERHEFLRCHIFKTQVNNAILKASCPFETMTGLAVMYTTNIRPPESFLVVINTWVLEDVTEWLIVFTLE